MASYADLVARLSHDRHLKGRQFERVCKWYLGNDPIFRRQIARVWLWKEWPGRWGPDAGIDLVAETPSGELWAVQAKAYAPSASVSKADIDTFLSESSRPQFSMRLLVATTDHLSHNAQRTIDAQEKPVRVVTASELRKAALDWPQHPDTLRAAPLPRKSPRPHQKAAIKDVLGGFRKSERGQLIMACGTGKTLASLWVWEALAAPTSLVVLPSISLLAQTVREWCANARTDFNFLAVCSDESVTDSDLIVRRASELPFSTTTEAASITDFLDGGQGGSRVIFSTYHSTPRIAEAVALAKGCLDLVIADEAHRCAGRVDGGFSTVLRDELIPAGHRLFMTATPRYLAPTLAKAAEELDVEVVSMDDEATFGPVFHKLTFGQAIAKGLLTDYQVAIIGVDDRRYLEMAEQARLVRHSAGKDGRARDTDARTLAAQAALLKGIAKYDLRRCVTFHSRIARAREFADSLNAVADSLPDDEQPSGQLWADHVSGAMRSSARDSRLDRLRSLDGCDRGLLANARCLAEGVDVPSLDAVAFIDPRGSQVDIVQAVGRVIRKAADKRLGTVILSVFVGDLGEAIEAVSGSAFANVWQILDALRAHDDVLAEELDSLRTAIGGGGKPGHPSKIRIDMPFSVTDDFIRAFDSRLLERTTQSWFAWYGLLTRFVEREGHARVPRSYVESGVALGSWVGTQRSLFARGVLDLEKAAKLGSLTGWSWDTIADQWDYSFEALREYATREGHLRVPRDHVECGIAIAAWATTQRMAYSRGALGTERTAKLESLSGWIWDTSADQWDCAFAALCKFVEREGHSQVLQKHRESGIALGTWVTKQRVLYSRGRLTRDRVRRLESLSGWTWDPIAAQWNRSFAALTHFVDREGHARVPRGRREAGIALGGWVTNQRLEFSRGRLSPERVAQLQALPGWTWDPHGDKWRTAIAALKSFVEREGHTRVPRSHVESDVGLGVWADAQRRAFSKGKLTPERVARLEALPGWSWDPYGEQWEQGFAALRKFVEREGNTRVPRDHTEEGIRLTTWVGSQRSAYSRGAISSERIARLEALPGWSWHHFTEQWNRGFVALRQFVEREGHAQVPGKHSESDFALGMWVSGQRSAFSRGKLSAERAARLKSLPGWTWDAVADRWDRSFAALEQFVEREGHARVPQSHSESGIALGGWVAGQRQAFSCGKLSPRKAAQLAALPGWTWDAVADLWDRSFAALENLIEREGHARVTRSHSESGIALGVWADAQRRAFSKGKLTPERVARLEALPGWTWDPRDDVWDRSFAALKRLVEREGSARVPDRHRESDLGLGAWVGRQRRDFSKGKLTPERIARLEVLPGWSWNPHRDVWDTSFAALTLFAGREGTARVPMSHTESGIDLSGWVARQRSAFAKGKLSAERAARLEALPGWSWDSFAQHWDRSFVALTQFVKREGHARVPHGHTESDIGLGTWVGGQRRAFAKGKLDPEKVAQLEALAGWSWDRRAEQWDRSFAALQQFVEREGHARVPHGHTESDIGLGTWVSGQRRSYARNGVVGERVAKLESLPGWTWDAVADLWDRSFAALQQFVEHEGHARVPRSYSDSGIDLGSWETTQRLAFSKGKLSPDRVARLESVPGWSWNTIAEQWNLSFAALQQFVEREGHAKIPQGRIESGIGLGVWVSGQRGDFSKGKLTPERVAQLEALPGWSWDAVADRWDRNFAALEQFVEREGHARVPQSHSESGIALGGWVAGQRQAFSKGKLTPEKVGRLESLPGWSWDPFGEKWDRGFAALRGYVDREGHARVPKGHTEAGIDLGGWVSGQRSVFSKGRLAAERTAKLKGLPGWLWKVKDRTARP